MSKEDRYWHQMTVMERCEVLKARLDRLGTDTSQDSDYTRTQAHHQEILSLCARVKVLEEPAVAAEQGWSVSEAELAWLRRVENAARSVAASSFVPRGLGSAMVCVNFLRSVLDGEPEAVSKAELARVRRVFMNDSDPWRSIEPER